MKRLYLLLFLLLSFSATKAQMSSDCLDGDHPVYVLDSFYFENNTVSIGKVIVDTTFPNNIWQIGTVQKPGFSNALSGTHALQTDTVNPYPVNNESAAILYLDPSFLAWGGNPDFSLTFWHYYNTDTLSDSCILQISVDSGKTWMNSLTGSSLALPWIYYSGSLNNYGGNPFVNSDSLFWTGNSGGWRKESVCVFYEGMKGMLLPRVYGFRFLFHSDSVETNKPGWIIDNIQLKSPQWSEKVSEVNAQTLKLYPNPSSNGVFNIDYPYHYVKGAIQLYNSYGQKVKQLSLTRTISIADQPKGLYHYRVTFSGTEQRFSGTLLYQ
jgi:hypothetical protein